MKREYSTDWEEVHASGILDGMKSNNPGKFTTDRDQHERRKKGYEDSLKPDKFTTTEQDHERSKRKFGLPKRSRQASLTFQHLEDWIAQHGPYAYHRTKSSVIDKILQEGLLPHDHEGIGSLYKNELVPRANHVYVRFHPTNYGDQRSRDTLQIDLRKIDPSRINADEDAFSMASQQKKFGLPLSGDANGKVYQEGGIEFPNWGAWADHHQLNSPEHTLHSMMMHSFGGRVGTAAILGAIHPEALSEYIPDRFRTAMAADPEWLQNYINTNGPYLYHATTDPETAHTIADEGLIPWDHDSEYDEYGPEYSRSQWSDMYRPRTNHVYMGDKSTVENIAANQNKPELLKIDLRKLDPANINPDEDSTITNNYSAQLHGNRFVHSYTVNRVMPEKHLGELVDYVDSLGNIPGNHKVEHARDYLDERNIPNYHSFGDMAEGQGYEHPEMTKHSLERLGTLAHRGIIPPEAIEYEGPLGESCHDCGMLSKDLQLDESGKVEGECHTCGWDSDSACPNCLHGQDYDENEDQCYSCGHQGPEFNPKVEPGTKFWWKGVPVTWAGHEPGGASTVMDAHGEPIEVNYNDLQEYRQPHQQPLFDKWDVNNNWKKTAAPTPEELTQQILDTIGWKDLPTSEFHQSKPEKSEYDEWSQDGDVQSSHASKNIQWVPTKHLVPLQEYDRTPGGPEGVSALLPRYEDLRQHISDHGFKNPIWVDYHPNTGHAHISEGNHRLTIAKELGIPALPVRVYRSRRESEGLSQRLMDPAIVKNNFNGWIPETLKASDVGLPTTTPWVPMRSHSSVEGMGDSLSPLDNVGQMSTPDFDIDDPDSIKKFQKEMIKKGIKPEVINRMLLRFAHETTELV